MRIRHALPLAMTLALVAAGCGDGGEEAAPEEAGPPVTADEVRPAPAGPDTAAPAAGEAPGAEEEALEAQARTASVYAVQVGAFVRDRNAASLRQRLEEAGLPVWTPAATVEGRSFERVRVGAAESVADARRLGRRIQERFGGEIWIAPVPPDEEVPSDLVTSTRRLLREG